MTEQEAKTKWCPMVRAAKNVQPVQLMGQANMDPASARNPEQARCIGSGCMMWRWDGWPEGAKVEDKRGHCGLSGPATEKWI